ncbi:MAG: sigma-70 family RNA polymerase sigma factor [Gemmatimonadaceae bacterium]|nr:sigma-70 family RNA polymerase sigma factor [Gemmatimonadaceae bacterium]
MPSPVTPDGPRDATPLLDALLERLGQMVRAIGGRHALESDEIDALLQEVRIRIWRAHPEREEIARLPTSYVYRTAMAAAVDLLRQRRRATRALPLEDAAATAAPAATAADARTMVDDLGAAIARALSGMVESRRAVVRLHLTGYPRDEIGRLLGWDDARVRNLLYRGMDDLRERLTQMGYRWPEGE